MKKLVDQYSYMLLAVFLFGVLLLQAPVACHGRKISSMHSVESQKARILEKYNLHVVSRGRIPIVVISAPKSNVAYHQDAPPSPGTNV